MFIRGTNYLKRRSVTSELLRYLTVHSALKLYLLYYLYFLDYPVYEKDYGIKPAALYLEMCGSYKTVRPSLLEMLSIFSGKHHNALAWSTALKVSALNDPTIAGQWMKMLDAFSSLPLYHQNPEAWAFVHMLLVRTKGDASGQELVKCLSIIQTKMFTSFTNNWDIVNTMYAGDDRYEYASKMHLTENIMSLSLPALCTCMVQ